MDSNVEYALLIRDMPRDERPRERLMHSGPEALSTTELLAITLRTGVGGENVVRLAERLLVQFNGLTGLARASINELCAVHGIGPAKAIDIKAAFEIGRRLLAAAPEERRRITSPADAANLLMAEMMLLEQEQLRLILLDTRNRVLQMPVIYVGSLNASVVRVGELFRAAIRENGGDHRRPQPPRRATRRRRRKTSRSRGSSPAPAGCWTSSCWTISLSGGSGTSRSKSGPWFLTKSETE